MNKMDFFPPFIVLEQSQVSPPPATIGNQSLPLTFFDIAWLNSHNPIHILFFYELSITKTQFTNTIVPNLKQSLSTTLQHFFPFAGKLTIFPTSRRIPEIRYAEGDSVDLTIAECNNLDFNDLTGNHPRECDKFYHLIPLLGRTTKVSDYVTIPVTAVQVTLFPNCGISIGMTNHHSLGDASTVFCFWKAWASIARCGSDEPFLANGTLPVYDRLINYPKLDESYLKKAKVENFNQEYQVARLSGPTDKVRATFIVTRTVINDLKKLVATKHPTFAYVSSFTVVCAYIWTCVAKLYKDELVQFHFVVDCRSRLDPPIPGAYFGNCLIQCTSFARTSILNEKEGFVAATKLIGENLHKILTDQDGIIVRDIREKMELPTRIFNVAGTPKLKFYDLDLGFGKPVKYEIVSIDYGGAISISACREFNEDLEIGVCLSSSEMDVFVGNFNSGLESYIQARL